MTEEERQAQLLDTYLAALQEDENAVVPHGLESDMASFARMFYLDQTTSDEASAAKSRVWQQINQQNTQMMDTPRSHSKNHAYQEMEPYMKNLHEKQKRSEKSNGFLPLAATAIVAVVVSLGLGWILFRNGGEATQSEPVSVETENIFALTATQLILEATATEIAKNIQPQLPTATPTLSGSLPTAVPVTATPFTLELQPTVIAPPTRDATLQCEFEGELILRISQSQVASNDTLLISGAALNTLTDRAYVEIFGGFLTDDTYQPILEIDNPPIIEEVLARIDGDAYPAGSYLVQLRLSDQSGETLSRCALPVTFSN